MQVHLYSMHGRWIRNNNYSEKKRNRILHLKCIRIGNWIYENFQSIFVQSIFIFHLFSSCIISLYSSKNVTLLTILESIFSNGIRGYQRKKRSVILSTNRQIPRIFDLVRRYTVYLSFNGFCIVIHTELTFIGNDFSWNTFLEFLIYSVCSLHWVENVTAIIGHVVQGFIHSVCVLGIGIKIRFTWCRHCPTYFIRTRRILGARIFNVVNVFYPRIRRVRIFIRSFWKCRTRNNTLLRTRF